MTKTPITVPHCQQCGSTDPEDVNGGDQGYSACCNEIVVWGGDCREGLCSHGEWDDAVYCDDCGFSGDIHHRDCSQHVDTRITDPRH